MAAGFETGGFFISKETIIVIYWSKSKPFIDKK